MAWNQSYVCMSCGGVYGPNLIVSNCWKSILWVWKRVRYKPDCFKWLEINHLCVWQVEEGTVQTWLCQMAGNQSYVCTACGGGRVRSKPVSNGWTSILCVCTACVGGFGLSLIVSNGWKSILCVCTAYEGGYSWNLTLSNGWKSSLCMYMACGGGQRPNLIVSNGWKSSLCVHCKWRRVQSKPDCVKWLEIKPICVDSMLHVLCKYCCCCCDMKPVTWPLLFFNKKKCYLSIDIFIYSTFAELNLLFIHTFYSVKHLKNIYIAHFYLACWQQ